MSTDEHLTTQHDERSVSGTPPAALAVSPGRACIVAAALALGACAVAAMVIWRPWGERNAFGYGDIAPLRDNLWLGTLIDSVGFAVAAVALALTTCVLVRTRGSRFADAGATLTALGGILFAAGSFAHAAVGWFATSDVISASSGRALLHLAEDQPVRLMLPVIIGFLCVAVGTLLASTALLRSGSVPRWVPIAMIVLTVGQFVVPTRAQDFVQITYMAVLVCLAGVLAGRTRS
jgi:hypothetical protein